MSLTLEGVTFESLLTSCLDRVPDTIDKREGSIIYDALAPACAVMTQLYIDMRDAFDQSQWNTASGSYLEKIVLERGLTRRPAVAAVIMGEFLPGGLVTLGNRFRCGDYFYTITGTTEDNTLFLLTCDTGGTEGNVASGLLVPVETIEGLESATVVQLTVSGEDEEVDDSLRNRYYKAIIAAGFGGNVSDYKNKVETIDGVGLVKVVPVWNGGGTVKLIITTPELTVPTAEQIAAVQEQVDPDLSGNGLGIAPIGHHVTVVGVVGRTIDIVIDATYKDGWSFEQAEDLIAEEMESYLSELAYDWDEQDGIVVRRLAIAAILADLEPFEDIQDVTINGVSASYICAADEIPVLGTLEQLISEELLGGE